MFLVQQYTDAVNILKNEIKSTEEWWYEPIFEWSYNKWHGNPATYNLRHDVGVTHTPLIALLLGLYALQNFVKTS